MSVTVGPAPEIERNHWGQALIAPPGPPTSKRVPYSRATTIAATLDDQFNLGVWKQRMVALGLVARPDLVTAIAACEPDDKGAIDGFVDLAFEASGANAARAIGTALHAFTERLDRGLDLGFLPDQHRADLDAYQREAERIGWQVLDVERFVVLDPHKIAGTADRIVQIDGRAYIADIKTGSSVDYPHAFAAQLAIYAHALPYNIGEHRREPWQVIPDQERALIIWLPAGQGRCEVKWLDIAAGWEAVKLAMQVRTWRKTRGLIEPYTPPVRALAPATLDHPAVPLILRARSVDELGAIWSAFEPEWTDDLTALAATRKAALQRGEPNTDTEPEHTP